MHVKTHIFFSPSKLITIINVPVETKILKYFNLKDFGKSTFPNR